MTTDSNSKYAEYLDLPPESWKRPDGPLRVWRTFESCKKTADGEVQKFSIEEVPEELKEEIVDFMEEYFLPGEAMSVNQSEFNTCFELYYLTVMKYFTPWNSLVL